jgi:formyl-CoA transferase
VAVIGSVIEGETPMADAPLTGLRVIEMGSLIAGPFCGQILGDFGAEVIKLEDPGVGDPMRQWGRSKPKGHSPWWPVIGRNKKSVTLNLRTEEGRDLARALIARADVVVENFRPGTLEGWGLGYEALSALNPGLVMARVSGFGQTGPSSHKAGYALIGEAMGGLRHITGEPDRNPARAGISIGDSLSGLNAALGVMMALHARQRTGRGQVVDAAIYESVLTVMENLITEYDLTGYIRERSGAVLPGIAPSNVYPTLSGELILIGANQDTLFRRLCDLMGRPDLADDVRYRDHAARGAHQGELDARIAAWTADHAIEDLLPRLEAAGIATGRIYRAPDMLVDPQFIARDSIVTVPHPVFGQVKMQNAFPRLTETPGGVRWPGPALGEHTEAVLAGVAGLSAEAIAGLRGRGVI